MHRIKYHVKLFLSIEEQILEAVIAFIVDQIIGT